MNNIESPKTLKADCTICNTVTVWTLDTVEGHEYYACNGCGIADLGAWDGQL